MISKAMKTLLLAAVAAGSLSMAGAAPAAAHGFGFHLGGFGLGHWGHGYGYGFDDGYRYPRFVRWNGCPAYYVRQGGLCYPAW